LGEHCSTLTSTQTQSYRAIFIKSETITVMSTNMTVWLL